MLQYKFEKRSTKQFPLYCSLAIFINDKKVLAILDTGAQISLINKAYEFEDKSIFENIESTKGNLIFAMKGSSAKRMGQTKSLEVKYRGKPTFSHAFEIIEMQSKNKIPFLINRDLIPKLGIQIHNLAYNFDEHKEIIYADTIDHEKYIPNVTKACADQEYRDFMERMKPYLEANANIDIHNLCPLKEAVYLKTPPNQYAYPRQYPIAYALQPIVHEQIKKWLDDKTIEVASTSGFNSPLTMVPKPNGPDGKKKWRVCLDTRRIY